MACGEVRARPDAIVVVRPGWFWVREVCVNGEVTMADVGCDFGLDRLTCRGDGQCIYNCHLLTNTLTLRVTWLYCGTLKISILGTVCIEIIARKCCLKLPMAMETGNWYLTLHILTFKTINCLITCSRANVNHNECNMAQQLHPARPADNKLCIYS